MADQCPVCHTGETQPGLDRSFCLNCGAFFAVRDGKTEQVNENDVLQEEYDGPLEPETKGGRGLPVATMGGSTESALQQEGALPQHGIPGRAANGEVGAYDTPDGFTAPASFNERLDPLAEGLAGAGNRVEEIIVVEEFVNSGESPKVVSKVDSQNADALGNPVAQAPLNPVHLDTAEHGATDEQPVLVENVSSPPTPPDNPDSLPAQKTAEQHGTGEVVNPPGPSEVSSETFEHRDVVAVPPTPVAAPVAENATPSEAAKTAAGMAVVDSKAEPASPVEVKPTESVPEPAAVDTPGSPKDNHDPAQNLPVSQNAGGNTPEPKPEPAPEPAPKPEPAPAPAPPSTTDAPKGP